jgi:hypothetical protein
MMMTDLVMPREQDLSASAIHSRCMATAESESSIDADLPNKQIK